VAHAWSVSSCVIASLARGTNRTGDVLRNAYQLPCWEDRRQRWHDSVPKSRGLTRGKARARRGISWRQSESVAPPRLGNEGAGHAHVLAWVYTCSQSLLHAGTGERAGFRTLEGSKSCDRYPTHVSWGV
jgi:hypothetical protein